MLNKIFAPQYRSSGLQSHWGILALEIYIVLTGIREQMLPAAFRSKPTSMPYLPTENSNSLPVSLLSNKR